MKGFITMFKQRRNFSAKVKSDLVIELLKGEKDLNTLVAENNIQPNLQWSGFRLHLIANATYEIPVAFTVTKASAIEKAETESLQKKIKQTHNIAAGGIFLPDIFLYNNSPVLTFSCIRDQAYT